MVSRVYIISLLLLIMFVMPTSGFVINDTVNIPVPYGNIMLHIKPINDNNNNLANIYINKKASFENYHIVPILEGNNKVVYRNEGKGIYYPVKDKINIHKYFSPYADTPYFKEISIPVYPNSITNIVVSMSISAYNTFWPNLDAGAYILPTHQTLFHWRSGIYTLDRHGSKHITIYYLKNKNGEWILSINGNIIRTDGKPHSLKLVWFTSGLLSYVKMNVVGTITKYVYLGTGDPLILSVKGIKYIPIPKGYSSVSIITKASIYMIKNGKTIKCCSNCEGITTINLKDVSELIIASNTPTKAILVFHKGDVPHSNKLLASIYFPLSNKKIYIYHESTINLKPYLRKVRINPVIITPYTPVDIELNIRGISAVPKSTKKVWMTKSWYTFTRQGTYLIKSEAVNKYGLRSEDTITVEVGNNFDKPPVVRIVRPVVINDIAVATPGLIEFEVFAHDDHEITMIKLKVGSKEYVECYRSASATLDWTVNLPVGKYKVVATAMDNRGQIGKDEITLIVRKVKPPIITKLSIISPIHWSTTKNCVYSDVSLPTESEFTVKADVKKGDYPIAFVEFSTTPSIYFLRNRDACVLGHYIRGMWNPTIVKNPPFIANLEVGYNFRNPYFPQTQLVIVKACDIRGFCSWKAFYIEGYPTEKPPEPPQVTILTPKGTVKPANAWIKARVVEPTNGHPIGSVMGYLTSEKTGHTIVTPYFHLLSGDRQDGVWGVQFNFGKLESGTYTLKVVATTTDGLTGFDTETITVRTVTITTPTPISTPKPTPTPACMVFVKPLSSFSGCIMIGTPVNVKFEATSKNCALSKVIAFLDGRKIYEKSLPPNVYDITDTISITSKLKEGEHTVRIVAYSTTGVSNSAEVKFKLCSGIKVKITGGNIISSSCIDLDKVKSLYFSYRAEAVGCKVKEVKAYLIGNNKNIMIYDRIFGDRTVVVDTVKLPRLDYNTTYVVKVVATSTTGKMAYDSVEFRTCKYKQPQEEEEHYRIPLYVTTNKIVANPILIVGEWNKRVYEFGKIVINENNNGVSAPAEGILHNYPVDISEYKLGEFLRKHDYPAVYENTIFSKFVEAKGTPHRVTIGYYEWTGNDFMHGTIHITNPPFYKHVCFPTDDYCVAFTFATGKYDWKFENSGSHVGLEINW